MVSSFAFMKILESTPERYDRGIEILSRGRIADVYQKIAELACKAGGTVLDLGCGTGNAAVACADRGASVTAIDINAGMLEIAGRKIAERGLADRIELLEIGVAEIEKKFGEARFDAVVSCLAFSELSIAEQSYAVSASYRVLKPGGILIVADEAFPEGKLRRLLHRVAHAPVRLIAYILTQSSTRPLDNPVPDLEKAGFIHIEPTRMWNGSFMIIRARKEA